MVTPHPLSADASNKFEDLSGTSGSAFANPYDALIDACHDDAAQIQARYELHRTTRNAQQKAAILAPDYKGVIIDEILRRLEDPTVEPGFEDPRHGIVFWARPPPHIKVLIAQIQERLKAVSPNLWIMPPERCHMTCMEICHSLPAATVTPILSQLEPHLATLTDYTYTHRARLIKPLVSYDGAAAALSFVPAAGEGLPASSSASAEHGRYATDDAFTYHHLRRDMHVLSLLSGVDVASRYVVPSAHVTLGRFLTREDHDTPAKRAGWIDEIERINELLVREFWPAEDALGREIGEGGEWIVGQGKGLDCRTGALWYGTGWTARLGKGF